MIQLDNAVERFGKIILNELKEVGVNCWVAGGSLRDYFSGLNVKTDYDLFFPNESEFEKAKVYFKSKKCEIKWESDNGMKVIHNGKTFDLVKKFFPTPLESINAFDFTVSMFAVDINKVYYGESSFIDLSKKQLMINKLPFPASTLSRAFRYYKKGYSMCKGEMKKLVEAIQGMKKQDEGSQDAIDSPPSGDNGDTFFFGFD